MSQRTNDLSEAFEFIPGRLYYVPLRSKPVRQKKAAFFSIDDELVYWNFFKDFGPLNLGQLFRFCQILNELLADPKLRGKCIYYYSSSNSQKRANAAFLISCYAMIYLGRTPEEAYAPFINVHPPFPPFHDATPFECTYKLSVLDCLQGVYKAMQHNFFNFSTFDVEEYEHFEQVEAGDLNWIMPNKFLAFAGPHDRRMRTREGYDTLTPEHYIPYFKRRNVTLVIRLNRKCYDEKRFERAGIRHLDLVYPDGTCPPDHILKRFIEACENNDGAIAVHCKAGLGRTGTCIGAYIMKHFGMTAAETIGWIRVCRPGSIIGPQQQFMEHMEPIMRHEGKRFQQRGGLGLGGNPGGHLHAGRKGLTQSFDFESKNELKEADAPSQGDFLRSKKGPGNTHKNDHWTLMQSAQLSPPQHHFH
ncbi:Dual specificity protein phosphatase CDC14A [Hondaea fermentalgiana]|uniref:protein-tyrosine-phosphatase n=1 Tax=Hondaea fermentalgiana TaxID=2315210 RepID=A0A2R5GCL2_9STRA|nr:Dual specificity protein phosphatase CDC14A [Hondaea fermentalgiana]|eukprot:GBG28720.1 Dual specificity protein phosphatase CDC14A [Hondaea fermentalgiana]